MNTQITTPELDRRQYIGSSDIAAIMGLSPWRTPLQVWESKLSDAPTVPPTPEKAAVFARGHRWEPVVREMLMDALRERFGEDGTILEKNRRYIDTVYPFMAAEIDVEVAIAGKDYNVELKTVHAFKANEWGEEGSDEIPVHYAAQAMYGLMVTGRNHCIVAALFGADNLVTYQIDRDEETIAGMRQKAIDFWNNNVLANNPPDPSNMQDMLRLFSKTNGRPVEADQDTAQKIAQLGRIRAAIKAHELEAEELQFQICDYVTRAWSAQGLDAEQQANDNAVLTINGQQIASWKKQRGTYLDQKQLKADFPEIVTNYTKEHWFRSIRIKKSK